MRARARLKSTRGGGCESRLRITRLLPNAAEAQPRNIKHEHLIVNQGKGNRGKGNGVTASNGSSQSARKNTASVRAEPIASSSISSLSRSGLMQRQRNEQSAKKVTALRLHLITSGVGIQSNLLTLPSIGEWPRRLSCPRSRLS